MRIVALEEDGTTRWGVATEAGVIGGSSLGSGLPDSFEALLAAGPEVLDEIRRAVEGGKGDAVAGAVPSLPIPAKAKIICVGLNYTKHALEGGHPIPTYPSFFLRVRDSLVAAGAPLERPLVSDCFDYEAELMVVIGQGGRHIREADALGHVFGYTIFNDGSIRDYQRKSTQWTAGKNFDRTGSVGPWIVTADELPAGASGLRIQARLEGAVMQDSDTSDMIFSTAKVIAILSEFMTLEPGDVIALGTPSGVGYARTPPVFMRPDQTVEIEIEGIGVLSNPIVAEAAAA